LLERRLRGHFLDRRCLRRFLLGGSLLRGRRLLRSRLLRPCFLLGGRRLLGRLFGLLLRRLFVVGHQLCPSFASRSTRTVRMRAISRLASFSRALFSSAPVADWKRRLNSSCLRSCNAFSSSSSVMSLRSLAFKEIRLSRHELRLHRELRPGEP